MIATALLLVTLGAEPTRECLQAARTAEEILRCTGGQAAVDKNRRRQDCIRAARSPEESRRCSDELVNGTPEEQERRHREASEARRIRDDALAAKAAADAETKRAADEAVRSAAAARAAAEASEAAERSRRWSEPRFQRVGWSSIACFWQGVRERVSKEVRTDQRYAKELGGVIDLRRMHDLQREARFADEHREAALASLRDIKVAPMPCSTPEMKLVSDCLRPSSTWQDEEGCAELIKDTDIVQAAGAWDRDIERGSFWPTR